MIRIGVAVARRCILICLFVEVCFFDPCCIAVWHVCVVRCMLCVVTLLELYVMRNVVT